MRKKKKNQQNGIVQFEGEMEYLGYNFVVMPDKAGTDRKVIQFHLKPHSSSDISAAHFQNRNSSKYNSFIYQTPQLIIK